MGGELSRPQSFQIIAAEENASEQRLLSAALRTLGCEPALVASGRETLEQAGPGSFDLIVLNSRLPDMPAAAVIEEIRRRPDWRSNIPILLIFPDSASASENAGRASGADAILSKPLQMSQFLAAVLRLAQAGRRLREQHHSGWSVLEYPVRGIEDLRAPAGGANFDVTQLRPGLNRGHITYAILGKSIFSFGAWESSTALRLRGDLFKDAVYFSSGIGPPNIQTFWGKDVPFGDSGVILAAGDGHEFDSVIRPGLTRFAAMVVPKTQFYELAHTLVPNIRRICVPMVFQPSQGSRSAATRAIHRAAQVVRGLQKNAATNLDSGALNLSILFPLIAALEDEETIRPMRGDRFIISRVEELARSQDIKKSVPGLCLQLGESRRRVGLAFRRQFDTSPAHYLMMFRLCRAREDLSRGECTAGRVAVRHGFQEFSRFVGRYRHAFGEYPSETLAARGSLGLIGRSRTIAPQTVDLLRRALR
jgi:CheY-like chemotaxis protein/AraC-like DNA-binding protein